MSSHDRWIVSRGIFLLSLARLLQLNGVFGSGIPSRSPLLYAFRGTVPYIMKIMSHLKSAKEEEAAACAFFDPDAPSAHHLVGPIELVEFGTGSSIEVADEYRSARAGLMMPIYASTLIG